LSIVKGNDHQNTGYDFLHGKEIGIQKNLFVQIKIINHSWYHICCSMHRKFIKKALILYKKIAADQSRDASADL
jgi:hypothetical protein